MMVGAFVGCNGMLGALHLAWPVSGSPLARTSASTRYDRRWFLGGLTFRLSRRARTAVRPILNADARVAT
jgi:hypothetical protein